jgi:hypothetical protein
MAGRDIVYISQQGGGGGLVSIGTTTNTVHAASSLYLFSFRHRLNMELDLQSLCGLHVYNYTL